MTLTADEVHALKKAPSMEGVLQAFHERWSPRSFAAREVTAEALKKLFEAARWAASSYNEQPWRFIVGLRGDGTWEKIFSALGDFNKNWAKTAPVLILTVAHTRFRHNGTENRHALYDLGAASSYLTLEAAALGLATHQMAGFDPEAARRAIGVPAEYLIGTVIALGYLGEPEALGDAGLIQSETTARARKPLDEIVYSEWGKAAEI